MWNVQSQKPIGSGINKDGENAILNSLDSVETVTFSPDGTTLASAGWNGTIILWDVQTHLAIGEALMGHTDRVTSLSFSPDGKMLAAGSDDTTITFWDVSLESWKTRACQIAGRNLTKQEWDEFIGAERPYHRTCPAFPPGDGEPADAP